MPMFDANICWLPAVASVVPTATQSVTRFLEVHGAACMHNYRMHFAAAEMLMKEIPKSRDEKDRILAWRWRHGGTKSNILMRLKLVKTPSQEEAAR